MNSGKSGTGEIRALLLWQRYVYLSPPDMEGIIFILAKNCITNHSSTQKRESIPALPLDYTVNR